ncbi:MAG: cache domain-containing protein [Acidobacteria bacterium]|nr:cache domain-containing protein [Acidobacteriota bacterium]MCA1650055.1 cache domain-containing protein [Acidobacteriota bacterium]
MAPRLPVISYRVLTILLIAALPVLGIGAALIMGAGQRQLRESETLHLKQTAEHTAAAVDTYVFRRIVDASVLSRVPEIRRAAAEGNKASFNAARASEIDRLWQKDRKIPPGLGDLLGSTASRFLSDVTHQDPVYREILVTDRQGRIVAASNVTSDYLQSDEDWWKDAFAEGNRGRVSVGDVRFDDSAGVYAFEIAVPVAEPGTDQLAGIMKIAADSREMLAGVGGLEVGQTGEVAMLRRDGSIVFSRQPVSPGARFFAAERLIQQLDAAPQNTAGPLTFRTRDADGASRVVAVAPVQLGQSYPNLAWLVAVSLNENELTAPFRSLLWYLLVAIAMTAIAVLVIALWLSLRLSSPTLDPALDMHLVEHAHRVEEHT